MRMKSKTKIKKQSSFIVSIIVLIIGFWALALFDIHVVSGGFLMKKKKALSLTYRSAAEEAEEIIMEKPVENLRVQNVKIESKAELFRKNEPIKVSCVIKNTSAAAIKNSNSVIRTPEKTIISKITPHLKPNEEFMLSGEFSPTESGQLKIACRSDIDESIPESNEHDNAAIEILYIF